jgi:6,7-dimethyl-8-ribityllumazine synthase
VHTGKPGTHLPAPASLPGRRFGIVVARFNAEVTEMLLEGCLEGLTDHGVGADDIEVLYVPGAWELPQTVQRAGRSGRFNAVIALGCVIRGETPHFDYVAGEAAHGLGHAARALDVPVIFGVLTTDSAEQAVERAGRDRGDKGREFALSALHMVQTFEGLE